MNGIITSAHQCETASVPQTRRHHCPKGKTGVTENYDRRKHETGHGISNPTGRFLACPITGSTHQHMHHPISPTWGATRPHPLGHLGATNPPGGATRPHPLGHMGAIANLLPLWMRRPRPPTQRSSGRCHADVYGLIRPAAARRSTLRVWSCQYSARKASGKLPSGSQVLCSCP